MANSESKTSNIPVPNLEGVGVETLAVRAGQIRSPELEHSEAIFPTSSFVFNSAEEAAARFVVSVGDVITGLRPFPGHLAHFGHD